jgi:hypothetical protein
MFEDPERSGRPCAETDSLAICRFPAVGKDAQTEQVFDLDRYV